MNNRVTILGSEWKIELRKGKQDAGLKGLGGYCDKTTRLIVIRQQHGEPKPRECSDLREYERGCLRHEIVHAFFFESGLAHSSRGVSAWAVNEEMVDWIAEMHTKIHAAYVEAGALV
jgi:hypothetical protein